MGAGIDILQQGREAYAARSWGQAHRFLSAADSESPLEYDDLVLLGTAAYLTGRDADSVAALTRAHQDRLRAGELNSAIRCALSISLQLMFTGDVAQASGWVARGERLLEECGQDCVEQGYLLQRLALQQMFGGEPDAAYEKFTRGLDYARRFSDPELRVMCELGTGQALLRLGRSAEGMSILDEVMVAVTADEVSPILSGIAYCAVISTCQSVFDLPRAREWTAALTTWCAAQPELVPYRGQCLAHRAEILQLRGAWPEAIEEAERARDQLDRSADRTAIGMALTQLGDVHRLLGDFEAAESAYREASRRGYSPQPGLAKLRLAQGQVASAAAGIKNAVDEEHDPVGQCKLLPAYVEIALAADDHASARTAADELLALAANFHAPLLDAVAAQSLGAVILAEGDPRTALTSLRQAATGWHEMDAPYETARTRMLIGRAYLAMGDEDAAAMELDAARWAFERLGAEPDLAAIESLVPSAAVQPAEGLTGREVEVLALVATGMTNRQIATELVISEKTVARHLSNIFVKLGVTSRAAATAYAFQHDLA